MVSFDTTQCGSGGIPCNVCVYLCISLDGTGGETSLRGIWRLLCAQLLQTFANVLEAALEFAALASGEQVDAVMLGVQDAQEGVAKGALGGAALAGYGDGLVCA